MQSPDIDDSFLMHMGSNYTERATNVIDTITLLGNLGFLPHPYVKVSFHIHTISSILGICFELMQFK